MREMSCSEVRVELSAIVDGEASTGTVELVASHVSGCGDCRAYESSLRAVKRSIRLQPAPQVPDLVSAIMSEIESDRAIAPPSRPRFRLRLAGIAAAVTALLLIGTSLPWESPNGTAAASEVVREVREAARTIDTYHARFDVIERGWHPDVDVRTFDAEVWFSAPESFRLKIRDTTTYPKGRWPLNDVDLVANEKRWWIREPFSCPTAALPGCAFAPGNEERTITRRLPFDGTTSVPTDIVIPLETLAGAESFDVTTRTEVLGRDAYRIDLPFWQAVPLIGSLQPGGSWSSFRANDAVQLWVDEETWFPLRYEVHSSSGLPSLQVIARSLDEPGALPASTFEPPIGGVVRDASFEETGVVRHELPELPESFSEYRSGTTASGQRIETYVDGMTWVRLMSEETSGPTVATQSSAELVELPDGGRALYTPGTAAFGRRVDIYSGGGHVRIESNLSRAVLIDIASSLDGIGEAPTLVRSGSMTVERIEESDAGDLPFARFPSYLPEGYGPSSLLLSRSDDGGRRLIAYYRRSETEPGGSGIRITQAPSLSTLPPSSEDLEHVTLEDGTQGRWSEERSEFEWIDGGVYRAVAVPGFDLQMAARIAVGLE